MKPLTPTTSKGNAREAGRGRTPYIPTHGPAKPGQILGPKVQIPLATPRPAQTLQPRPFYPGPAGRNIGGGTPKGGLITGLAEIGGQMLIPHISREAVRGAFVVTGQDTTTLDNLNAGRPVVVNIDGTSYNITTPEGLAAAQKARAAGGKKTIPAVSPKPTASLSETPPKPLQEETPARLNLLLHLLQHQLLHLLQPLPLLVQPKRRPVQTKTALSRRVKTSAPLTPACPQLVWVPWKTWDGSSLKALSLA